MENAIDDLSAESKLVAESIGDDFHRSSPPPVLLAEAGDVSSPAFKTGGWDRGEPSTVETPTASSTYGSSCDDGAGSGISIKKYRLSGDGFHQKAGERGSDERVFKEKKTSEPNDEYPPHSDTKGYRSIGDCLRAIRQEVGGGVDRRTEVGGILFEDRAVHAVGGAKKDFAIDADVADVGMLGVVGKEDFVVAGPSGANDRMGYGRFNEKRVVGDSGSDEESEQGAAGGGSLKFFKAAEIKPTVGGRRAGNVKRCGKRPSGISRKEADAAKVARAVKEAKKGEEEKDDEIPKEGGRSGKTFK